jgi:ribosome recycling factor
MAVMARETWTDERLDDLVKTIDKGFDETKVEIRDLRAHTDKGFARVDADIRELRAEMRQMRVDMKEGFDRMDARFDALQRTMIISLAGIVGSIVASVIGGLVVTQL